MVMDARSGEVLRSRNADTRLHPASLTKMMTLYIVFEAVRLGEITMDTPVTISRHAAATDYALGFRAGTQVELRYLVRAAAVRSSNDAAAAIAEAIEGSEAAFARRMNRTAQALGMVRTTFRNPHGLTAEGHLSTARDMTILGRHLFYDYPQYYNIFGRTSTYAGPVGTVYSTNRSVLNNYRGADGIKTGYTTPAGFNLVASAERDGVRILATVFGGRSAASRNARIMELLDLGFARAQPNVAVAQPALPHYGNDSEGGTAGRVIRVSGAVARSRRPEPRPGEPADIPAELVAAIEDSVGAALDQALAPEELAETPDPRPVIPDPPEIVSVAEMGPEQGPPDPRVAELAEAVEAAVANAVPPTAFAPTDAPAPDPAPMRETADGVVLLSADAVSAARPRPRPIDVADVVARAEPVAPEVVTRSASNGSRLFGVALGTFPTENAADRHLLTTALMELGTFDGALRAVARRGPAFEARFAGMTEDEAGAACARLEARNVTCEVFGPPG
ncbi:D-alanyl-D-alanine carboxypeptidase [Rhodobacterales bacterium HKCCE3408]|nr:D-alanyl-D-alanine carboxypeptidase [Rhodobacterales bacterium HKCCE3408]